MKDHGFEMDRATLVAWREFQARLADRLASMEEDDVAVVEAVTGHDPVAGAVPYVQFCAFGDGMLRGEVASNHVLDERWALGEESVRALGELGYHEPSYAPDEEPDHGSLNHYVDLVQAEADRLAVMATRALRDVIGVPHPALLSGDVADDAGAPVPEAAAHERVDEPVAAFPHGGPEELAAMVDRALTPYFGHEPRHDSDGDIPVTAGLSLFFVRVHEELPVVEMFGCVATDVTDLEAAHREVAILNRDVRFAKFRLSGDSIMVDLQLPAWPFVAEHLRAMVAMLGDLLSHVEDDLVERVGGRHVHALGETEAGTGQAGTGQAGGGSEESDRHGRGARDRSTYAELVLAQLAADERGSVDPELAASICGYDADVILDLIAVDEEQQLAWRRARDEALLEGNVDDVASCEAELRDATASARLLRRALRVVVEQEAAAEAAEAASSQEQIGRRRRRRRPLPPRPARPRRVPDPTIKEVDPDIWG